MEWLHVLALIVVFSALLAVATRTTEPNTTRSKTRPDGRVLFLRG